MGGAGPLLAEDDIPAAAWKRPLEKPLENPDMLSCKHQEQVLEIVFGKDCDGPFGGEPSVEERLADAPHSSEYLSVGQPAPFATSDPLGGADSIWC